MLNGSQFGGSVIQVDVWSQKDKGANTKKRPAGSDWGGGIMKKPMMNQMMNPMMAQSMDPAATMMNPMMAQMMKANPMMAQMMGMQQMGGASGMGGKGASAFKVTMDKILQLAPECKVFV